MKKSTSETKATAKVTKENFAAETESAVNQTPQRDRNFRSMQEWRDFQFFTCDEKTHDNVTKLLIERDYLFPSKLPNHEKITEEAQFFAGTLAERLSNNRRALRFGVRNISGNIGKLVAGQDLSALYFYLCNLYGLVFWRVPYNVQRLPVNPDAFSMFLSVYANAFVERLSSIDTEDMREYEEK